MLGLLPALFIAACVAAFGVVQPRSASVRIPFRDAVALSMLVAAAWSAVGGELLSVGAHLTFWPVLAWWVLPTAALVACVWPRRAALRGWTPPVPLPDRFTRLLIAVTASLLLATGLIALLTPPNTWDALTYHMPRQVYWMQRGGLAHYPSNDLRQLEFPPMAESAGVQLMILSGGDRWANMVGWGAFLGCVLVASMIARDLGAGARGQALAALLVATYPVALHHAVNPKNDLVVGLWLCLLAWLGLRTWLDRTCGPARTVLVGLALGLLLYTKGTGYLFVLPLGVLLGVWMLTRLGLRAIPAAIAIGLLAAGLNAAHWWRNYELYDHPLGRTAAGGGYKLTNEINGPRVIVSNVVRNLALHTPTPSGAINSAQQRWIGRLHEALGLDPNDPRTSNPPWRRFAVQWIPAEDEHAGAPVHLILAIAAPIALVMSAARAHNPRESEGPSRSRRDGAAWAILGAAWAMFLLFCLVLKWQPWHTRLHLPIFALAAPVCGLLLPRVPGGPLKGLLLLAAVALAGVALLYNDAKPVLGKNSILRQTREETLFCHDPPKREPLRAAVGAAGEFRPTLVGLEPGVWGYEYGMQRLVLDHLGCRVTAVRSGVGPAPPEGSPEPGVILHWNASGAALILDRGTPDYIPVAQFLPVTVYAREDLVRERRGDTGDGAPFVGWRVLEGLGALQPPQPELKLPATHASVGLRTRLEFESVGPAAELVLECSPVPARDQSLVVILNGQPVYRYTFGPDRRFVAHRVPLRPRDGRNEIEIRHGKADPTPGGEARAVLYSRIQVIPRPAAEPLP